MATEILMPALSPTMEEGTLAKWLVKEGDEVKAGDILAEIETDKATMEFEAVDEGIVGKILVAAGTAGVKVNTPIAVLVEEGESAEAAPKAAAPVAAAPAAEAPAAAVAALAPAPKAAGARIFASPLARRIAAEAPSGPCRPPRAHIHAMVNRNEVRITAGARVAACPIPRRRPA